MKDIWSTAFVAGAIAVAIVSCKNDNASAPVSGQGAVSGIVLDATTQTPLEGVSVTAQSLAGGTAQLTTGTDGKFRVDFDTDSTSSVVITFSKTGYRDTTIVFALRSGSITPASVIMTPKSVLGGNTGGTGGTGLAHDIAFLSADPQEITVHGVGGVETALLKWEVRDSLGIPIDAAHAISLTVTVQNGPNGGEYVSPSPITTNASGQAYTTLTSGIRSGVVQVVASGLVQSPGGGTVLLSTSPVRVVIDAGFPDQAHFTIGPVVQHNLPVLGIIAKAFAIEVLVGDRYSNPVAPKTAVYFRTSAGVVDPSVFTNTTGHGTVNLYTGNPTPLGTHADATLGDGYHYVVGTTIGQGGTTVSDSTLMLWSGRSLITNFTPTTFTIANGGSQNFSFTVADFLGHPLSAGTSISVSAMIPPPPDPNTQQNQVIVALFPGLNGTFVLEDELASGSGITAFTCKLSDGSTNITQATPVTLSVTVSGPNGSATLTIDGTVQ
jgi:hypothetical protein